MWKQLSPLGMEKAIQQLIVCYTLARELFHTDHAEWALSGLKAEQLFPTVSSFVLKFFSFGCSDLPFLFISCTLTRCTS